MIELEDKSCTIKVMGNGKAGYLYCRSGALIDAQIGELKGKEAAFALLEMDNSLIYIDYNLPEKTRTIVDPLMSLLLESGRKRDEKSLKPTENRRYKRFACTIPVRYAYDDKIETGMIQDISFGGILLKTKSAIPIGTQIQVALFSPSLEKGCKVGGTVVRSDQDGLGIKFQVKSMKQTGILRTVIIESQVTVQEVEKQLPN
jgi:hypothetical protein